jgi:hypothetical protein
MTDDALYFKLLFAINQIRRWAREVWSMGGCFLIGGEERRMKHIMDSP